MGFNIGDKVGVIPNLSTDRRYNGTLVASGMVDNFAGGIVTIKSSTPSGKYKIEEDGGRWAWTTDMLLELDDGEAVKKPTYIIDRITGHGSVITFSDGTRIYHPTNGNPIQLLHKSETI